MPTCRHARLIQRSPCLGQWVYSLSVTVLSTQSFSDDHFGRSRDTGRFQSQKIDCSNLHLTTLVRLKYSSGGLVSPPFLSLSFFDDAMDRPAIVFLPDSSLLLLLLLIYPLTARVVGAPQTISQPFPPYFPVLHCPLGLGELQACPLPDVVFPPLPLSALSSSPFHCALQDGFGQT